jgi:hypothetical protein
MASLVYEPNTEIIVNGLVKQPQLNGMKGKIHKFSTKQNRYLIILENGTKLAVASSSITLATPKPTKVGGNSSGGGGDVGSGDLRFKVGDHVQCNCSDGWVSGKVLHINYTETSDGPIPSSIGKGVFPYHVQGDDNNRYINVPVDDDRFVRIYNGTLALRFAVGTRVICWCGDEGGWISGVVQKQYIQDKDVFNGAKVPYQIKLDDGMVIYAPDDKDAVIRKFYPYNSSTPLRFKVGTQVECKYHNQWVVGTISALRYQSDDVFNGMERPYAIQLVSGETIYAPVDDDMVIKLYKGISSNPIRPPLRFQVGTRVACNCGEWVSGYIVSVYRRTASGLLPYYVQSDDGTMISVPDDVNELIRELKQGDEGYDFIEGKGLRFEIGTIVECNCGQDGWLSGKIDAVHFRVDDNNSGEMNVFPYRIQLDKGGAVRCPVDDDSCVRLVVDVELDLDVTALDFVD